MEASKMTMTESETLPPSLAAHPNIPWHEQTLDQLRAERAYWQECLDAAESWGASVGVAAGYRDACDRWIERRSAELVAAPQPPMTADPRPDLTKDAVLAPSDEAIGALATAMWDAVHTVRLSEHPEETEPMIERAKATARWLGRFGWSVVRSDAIAQAEQAATERAALIADRREAYWHDQWASKPNGWHVMPSSHEDEASYIAAAIRARKESTND